MDNVTFAAYTYLEVNDPRYDEDTNHIRFDTLRAINRLQQTLKRYIPDDYTGDVGNINIYPSKGKVNIKLRIPEEYDSRNITLDINDKEGIYETVLGMVMDGRAKG